MPAELKDTKPIGSYMLEIRGTLSSLSHYIKVQEITMYAEHIMNSLHHVEQTNQQV